MTGSPGPGECGDIHHESLAVLGPGVIADNLHLLKRSIFLYNGAGFEEDKISGGKISLGRGEES